MPKKLHDTVKHSVGTLSGDAAEGLITELVDELQHSLAKEKRWRELLTEAFDALPDGPHQQIVTIKGIGKQTAAAIVATAIDIELVVAVRKMRVRSKRRQSCRANSVRASPCGQRFSTSRMGLLHDQTAASGLWRVDHEHAV